MRLTAIKEDTFNFADMEKECGDVVIPDQIPGFNPKSDKRSWKAVAEEIVSKLTAEQRYCYNQIMGALGLTSDPAEKFDKQFFIAGDGGTGMIHLIIVN
jgi:hypothetical protein